MGKGKGGEAVLERVEVDGYGDDGADTLPIEAAEDKPEKGSAKGQIKGGNLKIDVKAATKVDPRIIKVDYSTNFSRWDAEEQDPNYQAWLAWDMSKKGNTEPVKVRRKGNDLYLVAGYNRRDAAIKVIEGFEYTGNPPGSREPEFVQVENFKLSVLLVTGNDTDMLLANIRENAVRKPLTAMDYANIVRKMKDLMGASVNEIADAIGCDPSYVSQYEKLLELDRAIQMKVHTGQMAIRAAMAFAELPEDEQKEMLAAADEDKAKGGKGKVTLSKVAGKLRDKIAETGEGKRISRTGTDARKFFESMSGPAEDPAIRALAETFVEWMKGKKTDKMMENALYKLLKASPADDKVSVG